MIPQHQVAAGIHEVLCISLSPFMCFGLVKSIAFSDCQLTDESDTDASALVLQGDDADGKVYETKPK